MRSIVTQPQGIGTLTDDHVVEGILALVRTEAPVATVGRRVRHLPERIKARLRRALHGTPYEEAIG